MFKKVTALLFTVFFIQTAAIAQSADYRRTLPAAQNGDATAQFYIGQSHKNGSGGLRLDTREAVKWLLLASKQGHAKASASLGFIYYNGFGTWDDPAKSLDFFHHAAANDEPDGWYGIGLIYYHGKGVEQNYGAAKEFLTTAANSNATDYGNRTKAQYLLGHLHTNVLGNWDIASLYLKSWDRRGAIKWYVLAGEGGIADAYFQAAEQARILEDYKTAAKYYLAEADRGHHLAQLAIARMYQSSNTIPPNDRLAIKYITLAISEYRFRQDAVRPPSPFDETGRLHNGDLSQIIGKIYDKGLDGGAPDYTQAAIWYEKAVQLGHLDALTRLGEMSFDGQGVPQSYQKAKQHWTMAAKEKKRSFSGATPLVAGYRLAKMYIDGLGGPKDVPEAVKWLTIAASGGLLNAHVALAYLYRTGEGIPKDAQKAVKWRLSAALGGDIASQVNYGVMLFGGAGIPQDLPEALRFALMAAEQGNSDGQFNAGVSYEIGRGTEIDYKKAMAWYKKAADQGHSSAMAQIVVLYANGMGVPVDYEKAYMYAYLVGNNKPEQSRDHEIMTKLANEIGKEKTAQGQNKAGQWFDAYKARQ